MIFLATDCFHTNQARQTLLPPHTKYLSYSLLFVFWNLIDTERMVRITEGMWIVRVLEDRGQCTVVSKCGVINYLVQFV